MKVNNMKSYAMRVEDAPAQKKWILIDADGVVLGRLAAEIATILRGKNKTTFSPGVDCGDNVIVINAEKVKVTGNKLRDKVFFYHTGYAGGIKERTIGYTLSSRFPERVIQRAVQRMLPPGPLGRRQLTNLRVFKGPKHTHDAQQPVVLNFAAANPKNKRIAK